MDFTLIDRVVVTCANLFNLVIVVVMLSRVPGWKKIEYYAGMINFVFILPLGISLIHNFENRRNIWMVILPGLLLIYLIIELILDYILQLSFRQSRWLGPYLLSFYLAQWGMVGYGFMVSQFFGFITLLTYFLSLGATAYSYKKVRHG